MGSNIIEGNFMHHPFLVHKADQIMPMAYLESMASAALQLLRPSHPNLVAFVLGYPVHMSNQQAIVHWINAYLREHPESVNFRTHVLPALQGAIKQALYELNISQSINIVYDFE